MKQRYEGPYLFLFDEPGTEPYWAIRLGAKSYFVHAKADDKDGALAELLAFASSYRRLPAGWKPKCLTQSGKSRKPNIYFVSTEDVPDYPIKIGRTDEAVEMRLAALQTSSPYRLRVMATQRGAWNTEQNLHIAFAHLRLPGGEWFKRGPDLLQYIGELSSHRPLS